MPAKSTFLQVYRAVGKIDKSIYTIGAAFDVQCTKVCEQYGWTIEEFDRKVGLALITGELRRLEESN